MRVARSGSPASRLPPNVQQRGGAAPSPRSPAALEAKILALEQRLRSQQDELNVLRDAHAEDQATIEALSDVRRQLNL